MKMTKEQVVSLIIQLRKELEEARKENAQLRKELEKKTDELIEVPESAEDQQEEATAPVDSRAEATEAEEERSEALKAADRANKIIAPEVTEEGLETAAEEEERVQKGEIVSNAREKFEEAMRARGLRGLKKHISNIASSLTSAPSSEIITKVTEEAERWETDENGRLSVNGVKCRFYQLMIEQALKEAGREVEYQKIMTMAKIAIENDLTLPIALEVLYNDSGSATIQDHLRAKEE